MKKLNIKEAEITKKMYEEAKKIENLWNKTAKMDCRTEEFKKLNNKVIELSDKFEEEVCDDFDTLEIVNEYERRMRKEKEENKQIEDKKMDIRGLEITSKMYCDAKKVENLWKLSEKNDYFDNIWMEKDNEFHKVYGDDFDTLEIIHEYERREHNTDKLLTKDQNIYEITYIGDTTREFKFFACSFDEENKELYMLKDNIYNPYPAVLYAPKIKKVECIERNNNLDFQ